MPTSPQRASGQLKRGSARRAVRERIPAAALRREDRVGRELGVVGVQHVRLRGFEISADPRTLVGLRRQGPVGVTVPMPAQAQFVERGVERAAP